ncbi:D-hexose-6-phosphate mutarotase, partial [Pseudomonas syringae pv. tagetis]
MTSHDPQLPEHPLQRFFRSRRATPTFEWERHQQRDVLDIDHPQCQAVFS